MFSSLFVSLGLAASALANVYITSPVASSTFPAGQQATVSWMDNGQAPSLAQFGPAIISIYVGNADQQTLLQTIATNVNVSNTSSVSFTPEGSIGPNSNQYFIRFESINLKDSAQPQYPEMAFSAKFTMTGMTGNFNSSVQAEIDGQSTAPIGTPTTTPAGASAIPSMVKTTASTTIHSSTSVPSPTANSADKLNIANLASCVGTAAALIGASLL
ncbi:hypothetical protein F5I97DRAFT_1901614 [Phlebopus sp. FC_14]|nr:hypothetical protein F5I97DRAFT_1901614 [Phlebopus sp. FC_14]